MPRIRHTAAQWKHSHEADWIFLGLILFVAATGVLQHALHRSGFDLAANLTYVLHMLSVVPMLALEVPFSKWAHLAYRTLGMYFAAVQADADAAREAAPAPVQSRAEAA